MSKIERLIIGALGGLSSVLVKFLGQDYDNLVAQAANLTDDQILSYKIGYGILTPILMFLGAFVAWLSDENKRMKLVALAIAAPAMITTWSGGSKAEDNRQVAIDFFLAAAHAQSGDPALPPDDAADIGATGIGATKIAEKSAFEQIKQGVGIFFGYGKTPTRYWVIVGSFPERDAAQQFADAVNAETTALNAWVGAKVPPNEFYPVIVGDYSQLSDAKALKEKALATKTIKQAYLSTGASRY